MTFANSTDWFVSFWALVGGRQLGWGSEALGELPSYGTPRLQGIKLPAQICLAFSRIPAQEVEEKRATSLLLREG